MLRSVTLSLCAALCVAQTPAGKPPAGVDEALRARINQFFQLLVESKFRQAEALVAEDSKDLYYNGQKPKFLSSELKSIEYSNEFTRAKATVQCEAQVPLPGFAGQAIKVPVGSTWKLVNGEWYFYVDPDVVRQTPFGVMSATAAGPAKAPGGPPPVIPTDPGFVLGRIKSDKSVLNLKAGESGQVTFTNSAPGLMSISLMGQIPGVDVKLDRVNLNAGEKAVVTLQAHAGAQSGTLSIQVEQTNEVVPIQVNVK